MKKYYRFFFSFLQAQENWLNRMAQKGYRLTETNLLSYGFEPCKPGEYEYRIEFIGEKSKAESINYSDFLKGLGYDVLYKNINLNWTTGKIKWRPYGQGKGQISTFPGTFNRELLIVGKKKDGKPFELHSTNVDKANYFKVLRNAWLSLALLFLVFAVWKYLSERISVTFLVMCIACILTLIPVLLYQKQIHDYKEAAKIQEIK